MQLSSIALDDPEAVWVDEGARSLAYFCRKKPVRVNVALIAELKEIVASLGDKNVRLCLHDSPDAKFHDMIILERKAKYYRPHKHLTKGESYHIIEGSMAAFVFDDNGRVTDACLLEPHGNFVYRVGVNTYHAVMPLSNMVIYHESKPGPFLGEGDSVYPAWAPDGRDADDVVKYKNELLQVLEMRSTHHAAVNHFE